MRSPFDSGGVTLYIFPIQPGIIVQTFIIQYNIIVALCIEFSRSILCTNVKAMSCKPKSVLT